MEDIWLMLLLLSIFPGSWLTYQLILHAAALMQWQWRDTSPAASAAPPVAFATVLCGCTTAGIIMALAQAPLNQFLILLAMAMILTALAFIDCLYQWLPDSLTLPLMWAGLLVNLYWEFVPLADCVLGAIFGYLLLWFINRLYLLCRRQHGIGQGDFKLLAALGAWGGWALIPSILLLASLCALLIGLLRYLRRRHSWQTPLPFGCYLAIAGGLAVALL